MTTIIKISDVEAVVCCCNGCSDAMSSDASVRAGADGNRTSDSSASKSDHSRAERNLLSCS